LWRVVLPRHRDEHETEAGHQGGKESKSYTGEHLGKEAHDFGGDQRPKV
jgi:hypothetical protein